MISYFTDGSASPNPGPGGFAVIKNGKPHRIGGEPDDFAQFLRDTMPQFSAGHELFLLTIENVNPKLTTNIRMEGLALFSALLDASGEKCQITTDSEFWINVLTKWAPTWEKNGWQKKGGIKNLDIVRPLYELYQDADAKLVWTRGHVGTELNELADEWANRARAMKVRGVQPV